MPVFGVRVQPRFRYQISALLYCRFSKRHKNLLVFVIFPFISVLEQRWRQYLVLRGRQPANTFAPLKGDDVSLLLELVSIRRVPNPAHNLVRRMYLNSLHIHRVSCLLLDRHPLASDIADEHAIKPLNWICRSIPLKPPFRYYWPSHLAQAYF